MNVEGLCWILEPMPDRSFNSAYVYSTALPRKWVSADTVGYSQSALRHLFGLFWAEA